MYHIEKHLTMNQRKYENMRRDFIDTLICAALMEKDHVALKSASLERKKYKVQHKSQRHGAVLQNSYIMINFIS